MQITRVSNAWLMDVAVQGQRVLMVGEQGVVLYADAETFDRPVNWQQAKVPVSVTLTAVAFASTQVAYAVGHDGVILKSNDAGASWRLVFDGMQANDQVVQAAYTRLQHLHKQSAPQAILEEAQWALEDAQAGARFGPTRPLLGVWFRNDREGWVVGSYGQLFYTQNGGESWKLHTHNLHNPDAKHFNGIVGTHQGVLLIAAEAGRVYRSDNFGNTWQRLETGYLGPWFGALPMPGGGVLAYGLNGHVAIQKTANAPWHRLPNPNPYSLVAAVPTQQGAMLLNQKNELFVYDHARFSFQALPSNLTTAQSGGAVTATAMAQQGQTLWLAGQGGPRLRHLLP